MSVGEHSKNCDGPTVSNCTYGGLYLTCEYCNVGYVVNDYGKCVVSGILGCKQMSQGNKTCAICDYDRGYFALLNN